MKNKAKFICCLLGFTIFFPVNGFSNDINNDSKLLFEKKCSRCHGIGRVTHTVKTSDQWRFTVNRMREKDKSWISEEETDTIAAYLASNFSAKKPDQQNHFEQSIIPAELPELFGIITFCLLFITVVMGFVMTHGKRKLFKIHRTMGYITFASGVIHGILIFITR